MFVFELSVILTLVLGLEVQGAGWAGAAAETSQSQGISGRRLAERLFPQKDRPGQRGFSHRRTGLGELVNRLRFTSWSL